MSSYCLSFYLFCAVALSICPTWEYLLFLVVFGSMAVKIIDSITGSDERAPNEDCEDHPFGWRATYGPDTFCFQRPRTLA